jgi:hypothetical protein
MEAMGADLLARFRALVSEKCHHMTWGRRVTCVARSLQNFRCQWFTSNCNSFSISHRMHPPNYVLLPNYHHLALLDLSNHKPRSHRRSSHNVHRCRDCVITSSSCIPESRLTPSESPPATASRSTPSSKIGELNCRVRKNHHAIPTIAS